MWYKPGEFQRTRISCHFMKMYIIKYCAKSNKYTLGKLEFKSNEIRYIK